MPNPAPPIYRDLSDWVVLQVLEAIRARTIVPGERLVEREVADRFDVSRAPVRDAFHKLERLDVVERVRPRGVRVREWTGEDAAEVYLIMDGLILTSVKLATKRLTTADLEALRAIVDEAALIAADGGDGISLVSLDQRFHSIIATASGRRRLASLMESLTLPITLYSDETRRHMEPQGWHRMHAELLGHLERRDTEAAVACVLRNANESEIVFMRDLEASGGWHDPLLDEGLTTGSGRPGRPGVAPAADGGAALDRARTRGQHLMAHDRR